MLSEGLRRPDEAEPERCASKRRQRPEGSVSGAARERYFSSGVGFSKFRRRERKRSPIPQCVIRRFVGAVGAEEAVEIFG